MRILAPAVTGLALLVSGITIANAKVTIDSPNITKKEWDAVIKDAEKENLPTVKCSNVLDQSNYPGGSIVRGPLQSTPNTGTTFGYLKAGSKYFAKVDDLPPFAGGMLTCPP